MSLSGPVTSRDRSQLGKLMNDAVLNTNGTYDPRFRKVSPRPSSSLLRLLRPIPAKVCAKSEH